MRLPEPLLFHEVLGLVEHAEVDELAAIGKWHVGVRVLQGVEPWDTLDDSPWE